MIRDGLQERVHQHDVDHGRLIDHEEISAVEWCDWETVQQRWATLKGGIFPPVREYLERVLLPTAPAERGEEDR